MSTRVGINGFGRIGRLALRAAWGWPDLSFAHVNEPNGDAATAAHLLTFDSVHGRWSEGAEGRDGALSVGGTSLGYSEAADPGAVPWAEAGVEIVLECSGAFRTAEALEPYFRQGVALGPARRRAGAGELRGKPVYGLRPHAALRR